MSKHRVFHSLQFQILFILYILCLGYIIFLLFENQRNAHTKGQFLIPQSQRNFDWQKITIPSIQRLNLSSTNNFKYFSDLQFDSKGNQLTVLDRSKYSIELLHLLGLNSTVIDSIHHYQEMILLLGSETVLGTQFIKTFEANSNHRNKLLIKIRNIVDLDFSSNDIQLIFDHIKDKLHHAIFIYQPNYLYENASDDGSNYLEEKILNDLYGLMNFITFYHIQATFVIPPPHFELYEKVLKDFMVVYIPHLIDFENIQDPNNLISRMIFQCKKSHQSDIIYSEKSVTDEFVSSISIEDVAMFLNDIFIQSTNSQLLLIDKGNNKLSIKELKEMFEERYQSLAKENCEISFKKSPHQQIRYINYSNMKYHEIQSHNTIQDQLTRSISNLYYESAHPYLSIVFTGRNDDYGKGFIDRAKYFFYYLYKTFNDIHKIANLEVIVVDYATADDRKPLHSLFSSHLRELTREFSQDKENGLKIRFIQVPESFHKQLPNTKVPFLEYWAKNIGIRRAHGEFVLAMNPDSLLSTEFMHLVSCKFFNHGLLYTSTRIDMEEEDSLSIDKKEKFIHRIFEEPKIQWLNSFRANPLLNESYKKQIETQKSHDNRTSYRKMEYLRLNLDFEWGFGDFQMLSKVLWNSIDGFGQFPTNSYVDNLLFAKMQKIISSTFSLNLPAPFIHQYHDMVSRKRPHSITPIQNAMIEYDKYGQLHQNNGTDSTNWGFPNEDFAEVAYVI